MVLGTSLIALGLLLLLVEKHVSGLKAWDRPAWSRTAWHRPAAFLAAWGALGAGVVLAFLASPLAATILSAALAGAWAWTRWVRSERHLAGQLDREIARLRVERPEVEERELMRVIVLARHPRWGEELVEQMVAEQGDVRTLAAMLLRMERASGRPMPRVSRAGRRRGT